MRESDPQGIPHGNKEITAASKVIERYRSDLDWIITVPELEEAIIAAAKNRGAILGRQGISARNALLSIPIELKKNAIRDAIQAPIASIPLRTARKLRDVWHLAQIDFHRSDAYLSRSAWDRIRGQLTTTLATRHIQYDRAQDRLFHRFKGLSKRIALKIDFSRHDLDDCIQEGYIGLLQAIDKIQSDSNFEAYASQWIARRIRNFLIKESLPLSAPINAISLARKKDPTQSPSISAIREILRNGFISIDESIEKTSSRDASPCLELPSIAFDEKSQVRHAVAQLTPKQQDAINLRFGLGDAQGTIRTQSDLAQRFGISRQQVARREKRALANLQKLLDPIARERASPE